MLDNEMLKNHKLFAFWGWCLLKATHKKRTAMIGFTEIELQPGQFIYGRKKASKELNMSERCTRTCLKSLIKSKNVTSKATNKFSIITICKWDTYQNGIFLNDQQSDQQVTSKRPASDQQATTDKHVKNKENVKNKKEKLFNELTFHNFYYFYPKKSEKAEAKKQWLKLNNTDLTPKLIIDILITQNKANMFPSDLKYIMSPRKWLFGKRWEDEIIVKTHTESGRKLLGIETGLKRGPKADYTFD